MARKTITTPAGIAVYPRLTTPDTKFNARGLYQVKLRLAPSPEAEAFIERLNDMAADAIKQAKADAKPGKRIKAADTSWSQDEETGDYLVNFKMVASGETRDGRKFEQRPAIFDAKGKPMPSGIKVGGGSTIKVAFEPNPFVAPIGAGVSLRLKAVQVIDLVEFGGASADYYGFAEEDGFDASTRESQDDDEDETDESTETEDNEDSDEDEGEDTPDF